MTDGTNQALNTANWNVLTSPWLEVMDLKAESRVLSPFEALRQAADIRCLALSSPVDFFAAQRFLLTLLYWKAVVGGGVEPVRSSLLSNCVPTEVLDALQKASGDFALFGGKAPFLQDVTIPAAKRTKSAGSLFAEFACGTNVAHFHHGDDDQMCLCAPCATIGMVRVVPWTQSGGSGLTPSVHNAPPIMAVACGQTLAESLGLNLVPLECDAGVAQWTGHFKPTGSKKAIPYLEALTWNPRRVLLGSPEARIQCWRCGSRLSLAFGPICYLKNPATKKRSDGQPFEWQDPAAFYRCDKPPFTTWKSNFEEAATHGRDLRLLGSDKVKLPLVNELNPDHRAWRMIIPCTKAGDNKSFDHRQIEVEDVSSAPRVSVQLHCDDIRSSGVDGWGEPSHQEIPRGVSAFVKAAPRLFTAGDWAVLSAAELRDMHQSPAGFDLLVGLLWPLRQKQKRLPSRGVAWLVLKLMATVPANARLQLPNATFCPLRGLLTRQPNEARGARSSYPTALPSGRRLEMALCDELDRNRRRRDPEKIDWAGLCHRLDPLLD